MLTEQEKVELYKFCVDHVSEFGGMPTDFEVNDKMLSFDEYTKELTDEQHQHLTHLINHNI